MSSLNRMAYSLNYCNNNLDAVDFPQPMLPLNTLVILHGNGFGYILLDFTRIYFKTIYFC